MDPSVPGPYGAILDGALGVVGGRLCWVGPQAMLPRPLESFSDEVIDLDGRLATPALIDCHTHLVFAGDRAAEFEMRLNGATYEDIARAGGGVLSTVAATRAATVERLVEEARPRIEALMRGGVATVEIKSGYGLTTDSELAMLAAAERLGKVAGVRVRRTFLGLHALPPEFADDRDGYVSLVADDMIPAVAASGAADAVDVFCEGIGFTVDEVETVFRAARAHGLRVKAHAEQLSPLGGAALAAQYGALSADHLEYLDAAGAARMAESGVTAVLLPGAFYALREAVRPPVDLLRAHGVPIAVASDLNPGTSPMLSPALVMNMACTLFRMTPEEALAGMTRNAAKALGLSRVTGMLRAGLSADFAVWDVAHPAELSYWIGLDGPARLYLAGAPLFNGKVSHGGPIASERAHRAGAHGPL